MNAMRGNLGWIEVICGPMFSGKSEELIRRLRRAEIARQRVQIFKPMIDQRYASDQIVSHDDGRIHAEAVSNAMEVGLPPQSAVTFLRVTLCPSWLKILMLNPRDPRNPR